MTRQPSDPPRFRLNIGPLAPGQRMGADEYIATIEEALEAEEQRIDEQWRQLHAEIATSKGGRRRGRPRKQPVPPD